MTNDCLHCICLFNHSLKVLKVAILAEKYALDYTWYVDTILNLIRVAGDYVSEEASSSCYHLMTSECVYKSICLHCTAGLVQSHTDCC